LAAEYCLDAAGISWEDVHLVVHCGQRFSEAGSHIQNSRLRCFEIPVKTISHHLGHAIGVYACSGFSDATVVVVDGNGSRLSECDSKESAVARIDPQHVNPNEWASVYSFKDHKWECIDKHVSMGWVVPRQDQMGIFASLGGMYSASAEVVFGDFMSGAGKLMGLAAYGQQRYSRDKFFIVDAQGSFFWKADISDTFNLGHEWPSEPQLFADLAASTQAALEYGLDKIFNAAISRGTSRNLCYTGGVSLNTVFNNRLFDLGLDDVFILPAADDAGTAIGAAFYGLWELTDQHRPQRLRDDGLGRDYDMGQILTDLRPGGWISTHVGFDDVLDQLERGEPIAWFEGRSEFGPRALGHRSLLFDPRRKDAVYTINNIKGREQFRPLAPSVLVQHVSEWFDIEEPSPFMLRSVKVKEGKRKQIPGVLHVDGTSRPQTVNFDNGDYYALIHRWFERTGVPMLLNTSFNGPEEPIVETPSDAVRAAARLGIRYVHFPIGGNKILRTLVTGR
jgi:carbamoyltransferase